MCSNKTRTVPPATLDTMQGGPTATLDTMLRGSTCAGSTSQHSALLLEQQRAPAIHQQLLLLL